MKDFVGAIVEMVDAKLSDLNTVDVGVLTDYNPATGRCNLKLKRRVNGHEVELFEVPVAFPRYNGCTFIARPAPGDPVVVAYSKFDLETQLVNRDIVEVGGVLRFDLNNAVVIGGLVTLSDVPPDIGIDEAGLFHKSGSYLKFTADGDIQASVKAHFDITKWGE